MSSDSSLNVVRTNMNGDLEVISLFDIAREVIDKTYQARHEAFNANIHERWERVCSQGPSVNITKSISTKNSVEECETHANTEGAHTFDFYDGKCKIIKELDTDTTTTLPKGCWWQAKPPDP